MKGNSVMNQTAENCHKVAGAAQEALQWLQVANNAERVGPELPAVRRDIQRLMSRARKLHTASQRNMCAGVYGPSQAGKSFLVSVLARPQNGPLMTNFSGSGGVRDFIKEVNPEGEGESTGLVTRFTMHQPNTPEGFPIQLRLLSEADIARVLINTFFKDGDMKVETPPSAEAINELITDYRPRMVSGMAGLTADDMHDIHEYVAKNFGQEAYAAQLRGYWDAAAEIAPSLGPADRGEFLSVLWGGHEPLTGLFRRLTEHLSNLGHPAEIYCGFDALFPREESIIDVKMLAGLDHPNGHQTVQVRGQQGPQSMIPKPDLTALTAELVVPMHECPWPLFEHTDLLDFPGARSRFKEPIARRLEEGDSPLKDMFLRGKVAYLFDRYVAEQELTSMLLCIPDSNLEVTDLPDLVQEWITETHGATPEERGKSDCILFFILTKFDKHLGDSAGSSDDEKTRFQRRMEASLIDPFGKMTNSWPNNWAGTERFTNCFWLRNPNYFAENIIEYDTSTKREVGFLTHKMDRINELRDGCLRADAVQHHFADPMRAWDAAMALNDGGISYLVEKLTPVCNPSVKARQISVQLARVATSLVDKLAPYYISDDMEKRLTEKRQMADQLVALMNNNFAQNRFGSMLDSLMVDANALSDRIARPAENIRFVNSKNSASESGAGQAGGVSIPLPGGAAGIALPGAAASVVLPGNAAAVTASATSASDQDEANKVRQLTRPEFYAECSMAEWIDNLHANEQQNKLLGDIGFDGTSYGKISGELVAAARRMRLQDQLRKAFEANAARFGQDAQVHAAATVGSTKINDFVATASMNFAEANERADIPTAEGGSRKAFAQNGHHDNADDLPEQPRADAVNYATDWFFSFYKACELNAMDSDSGTVDVEANSKLGGIISDLRQGITN